MDSITIGTEELEDSQSHRKRNVSTMEIVVSI
jgi:DNA-binding protein